MKLTLTIKPVIFKGKTKEDCFEQMRLSLNAMETTNGFIKQNPETGCYDGVYYNLHKVNKKTVRTGKVLENKSSMKNTKESKLIHKSYWQLQAYIIPENIESTYFGFEIVQGQNSFNITTL